MLIENPHTSCTLAKLRHADALKRAEQRRLVRLAHSSRMRIRPIFLSTIRSYLVSRLTARPFTPKAHISRQ